MDGLVFHGVRRKLKEVLNHPERRSSSRGGQSLKLVPSMNLVTALIR